MARKATTKAVTNGGETVNVYAEVASDGMVGVWTKHQHLGYYLISRFENNTLTSGSLRKLIGA